MEEKKLTGYPSIDKPWMKYYKADLEELQTPMRVQPRTASV